jgi:hypothetical protein
MVGKIKVILLAIEVDDTPILLLQYAIRLNSNMKSIPSKIAIPNQGSDATLLREIGVPCTINDKLDAIM